jgi:Family of unknown function (DUF5681)
MPSKRKEVYSDNYRKPPTEFRFEKGKSGNPRGRPKKKAELPPTVQGIQNRLSGMILEEGMRLVMVKEGNKVYQLPAMQAVLRTLIGAAAKGDVKAAQRALDFMSRSEDDRINDAVEAAKAALQYKEKCRKEIEAAERKGQVVPEHYPDPDDIIINESTCEVTIDGPLTLGEAGARRYVQQQAVTTWQRHDEVADLLAQDPKNRQLKAEFLELNGYRAVFEEEGQRNIRREARQLSRQLETEATLKRRGGQG